MNKEENLSNMKKIKNNLSIIKSNLKTVNNLLNQSIVINGVGFKTNNIEDINHRLNKQIDNLDKKIILKIENM